MIDDSCTRDLHVRGCPACSHLDQRMTEYFAEQQGRLSRSEEAQSEYANQRGYCPLHTWQLAAFSSPRGLSRGLKTIIRRIAELLNRLADSHAESLVESLPAIIPDECVVCHFLKDTEARYVKAFARFLEENGNLERYKCSHGLCLRHLQLVLARMEEGTRKVILIRLAADRLWEISESMVQYDLKHEELKRELLTRDEKDAYRRCLVMLSGERTVV